MYLFHEEKGTNESFSIASNESNESVINITPPFSFMFIAFTIFKKRLCWLFNICHDHYFLLLPSVSEFPYQKLFGFFFSFLSIQFSFQANVRNVLFLFHPYFSPPIHIMAFYLGIMFIYLFTSFHC